MTRHPHHNDDRNLYVDPVFVRHPVAAIASQIAGFRCTCTNTLAFATDFVRAQHCCAPCPQEINPRARPSSAILNFEPPAQTSKIHFDPSFPPSNSQRPSSKKYPLTNPLPFDTLPHDTQPQIRTPHPRISHILNRLRTPVFCILPTH
jgi:hypothetical protein